jgi:hypothetical protein
MPTNDPEFSVELLLIRLSAKGIEAVRPIAWGVLVLLLCYSIRMLWGAWPRKPIDSDKS